MLNATLIYTSKATTPVTMESLKQMAHQAALNNAQQSITGLLLYGSGHYLQVLEGNPTSLKRLYDRISKDTRHMSCDVLYEHKRVVKLFPKWNMGQLNLESPGLNAMSQWELISSTLSQAGAVDWKDTDPVIGWVREFMEHNGSPAAAAAMA
ncbi:MAG: BLUF domain-containing protein [Phycisphaeraceae bacterium]|nr:BLUF domain-containing protein [Phycisphaeraceae bacterium]